MTVTIHSHGGAMPSAQAAQRVYRGMRCRTRTWSPLKKIYSSVSEWERFGHKAETDQVVYNHVLADLLRQKQENAVSFSISKQVATCYALSDQDTLYSSIGFVGTFKLARIRSMYTFGGEPFLYVRSDKTVWLDPRHWFPKTSLMLTAPLAFDFARNCARSDHELLLVYGTISATKLQQKFPAPRRRTRHFPLQHIMKMVKQSPLGSQIVMPHVIPFDQLQRLADERQHQALIGILTSTP